MEDSLMVNKKCITAVDKQFFDGNLTQVYQRWEREEGLAIYI